MIEFADFNDVLAVADNMREADAKEIYATMHQEMCNPESLARFIMSCADRGMAFVAVNSDKQPVAIFGAREKWPKVWSVFMFATDEFQSVGLEVTRFIKRRLIRMIANTGAHRADCHSAADHVWAHRWLEMLGATRTHEEKKYGKGGEDFYCYAWFDGRG